VFYSGCSINFAIMLRYLEVICGLARYPASLLHRSRPAQGGARALNTFLGPTVSLIDNEWAT
jgi:hypothetical protein